MLARLALGGGRDASGRRFHRRVHDRACLGREGSATCLLTAGPGRRHGRSCHRDRIATAVRARFAESQAPRSAAAARCSRAGKRSRAGPVVFVAHRNDDCGGRSPPPERKSSKNGHLKALPRRQGRARRRDRVLHHLVLQLVRGQRTRLYGESMWHGIGFLAGILLVALIVWQGIRLANIEFEIGVTPVDDHRRARRTARSSSRSSGSSRSPARRGRDSRRPDDLGVARPHPLDRDRRRGVAEHEGRGREPDLRQGQGAVDDGRRRRSRRSSRSGCSRCARRSCRSCRSCGAGRADPPPAAAGAPRPTARRRRPRRRPTSRSEDPPATAPA